PRTRHHLDALKAQPPKTPANLERLEAFTTRTAKTSASKAIASAEEMLRAQRYRTQVFGDSVSAERGYLRETGNLVFHSALIGMLVAVGLGSGFGYTGQRVVVEGYAFNNSLASYDSFNPGRFFDASSLAPYSIALDRFDATYEENNLKAYGQATDYTATVTSTLRGQQPQQQTIKVNSPLEIAGDQVYLLGNGYAPVITVRDPDGHTVYSQPVPFLPQDANLFSLGIIKVPDGLSKQIGMRGLLYPTALRLDSGTFASSHPALRDPLLTLEVFTGDLGLDNGKGTNAYALNTDSLTEIAGRKAKSPTIALRPGDRVDLPNGLGSVELTAIPRFVSLDVHHDPAQGWALVFAILIVSGLLTSLFVPRRRMWVRAVRSGRGTVILEYAALARGDDPGLDAAVQDFAERRSSQLGLKVGS
ncbi:MAG: cytochrome c biogenesis protein ResB, partial [Salinibacterium sp.]